jgi:hypothetical protein
VSVSPWPALAVAGLLAAAVNAFPQEVQLWSATPAEKVFRDTPARPLPAEGLALSAGAAEYEAVQLVVKPSADLPNVTVVAGSLTSPRGRIPAADIQVLEVRYVSVPHTKEKFWPDPLPPHLRPLSIAAGENQPFWIKILVPARQTPGEYHGTVDVTAAGKLIARVPLKLTVYPFTIPDTPSVRTAFGISRGYLANHHTINKKLGDDHLYARYYEMLLDHRVSAYDVPFGLMSPKAEKYLRDPRLTAYVLPYTEDRDELIALRKRLAGLGVFGKGIFYPIDEPYTKDSYRVLQQRADWIHSMTGGAPVCSPFFRGPDFDSQKDIFDYAASWLDIWCINTGYYGPKQMAAMEERRKAGGELWWYVCCGPGQPKANFFVTMEAMRHRMLFWQMYKYDIKGLLYWSTTYWNPSITKDPWEDMATVKDINPKLYGDGSLLYPGTKHGVNGPVSSQRLECILDGLEDIEYLKLVERKCGRATALRAVDALVTDMNEYSLDAADLTKARQSLAGILMGER